MDSATKPQSKPAKSAVRLGENGNKLAMACNDEEDQPFEIYPCFLVLVI